MTEPAAGATPGTGATPAQPGQPPPAPPPAPPATGDDGLGDAGRRALEAERQAAKDWKARAEAAERERDDLKKATQTDQDKAIDEARKEGAAAADAKHLARIRELHLQIALSAAGVTDEKSLELAVAAPIFRDLRVGEDGKVEGLATAVEQAKKDYPALFGQRAAAGDVTRGAQGTPPAAGEPGPGGDRLRRAYAASASAKT